MLSMNLKKGFSLLYLICLIGLIILFGFAMSVVFTLINSEKELWPDVSLTKLSGETLKLEPDRAKVIHLWHADCELCFEEMAFLERVARSGRYPQVDVWFINIDDTVEQTTAAAYELWRPRVLVDEERQLAEYSEVPKTLFISTAGELYSAVNAFTLSTFEGHSELAIGWIDSYIRAIAEIDN